MERRWDGVGMEIGWMELDGDRMVGVCVVNRSCKV
jgi:hypothetical protein